MAINCPYCGFEIELTGIRPGRFKPNCPGCGKRFRLRVPEEQGQPVIVKPMEDTAPTAPPAANDPTIPASTPNPRLATAPTLSRVGVGSGAQAATMPASGSGGPASSSPPLTGQRLGGYQVEQELGRGAMGVVYRARQLSLDRPVAVKVMNPAWASDPVFVSRFTREAYAAAHLVHHNVVQIYDIGNERDVNFFSMEFVDGQSLLDLLNKQGNIDVAQAVGYVLQAARGLKFAHENGMVHRDVKPDNLLLNAHGIVKVADLGLVKTPDAVDEEPGAAGMDVAALLDQPAPTASRAHELTGGAITQAQSGMGTPAYMAPEQAMDSASVDGRADIYSLGCTLYVLLTGRYVHDAHSTAELLTKTKTEKVRRPSEIEPRVPAGLSDIIMKMVAHSREHRYQSLDDVIRELEAFLGVDSVGPFAPAEAEAVALERAAEDFSRSKIAVLRSRLIGGFFAAGALVVIAALAARMPAVGLVALLTPVFSTICYQLIAGLTRGTPLFDRARQFLYESRWLDRITLLGVVVLGCAVLAFLGWQWIAAGAMVISMILAAGFAFTIDRLVAAERQPALDALHATLRMMRLHGAEERALQQFVCQYGGDRWEPLFEAAFGYDAKIAAREQWGRGEQGRRRRRHAAWRDAIINWFERQIAERRARREKKHLERVERKALRAQGLSVAAAQREASAAATQIMATATVIREKTTKTVTRKRRIVVRQSGYWTNQFIGARTRFLVGACLLLGCLLWMHQNNLIPGSELRELGEQLTETGVEDAAAVGEGMIESYAGRVRSARPLRVSWMPGEREQWFDGFAPGVAGLVLVLSALVPGWLLSLLLVPGLAVMLLGEKWGIPGMWEVSAEYVCLALGFFLCIPAWLIAR